MPTIREEGTLNYARPRTRSKRPVAATPRGVVREIVVGGISAGILALIVFVALAAPSAELRADVGPIVPRPGNEAVVEGRVVDADGAALEGAEVAVLRTGGRREIASSGEDGTFRVVLPGGCGTYRVLVRAEANGDDVATASKARLCPGDSLPVDARVVTFGHFLWVPGPR